MRKFRNLSVLILLIGLVYSCKMNFKTPKEPWEVIFNGRDLEGWSIVGSKGRFWVEDSIIMCHRVRNTPEHTFLVTNKEYDNFILECDVKVDEGLSSGILFRCIDAPDTVSTSLFGYQIKIDDTPRKWTGGLMANYGETTKWYHTLKDDSIAREAFKINVWNRFRVEVIDSLIKVWINEIPTCNVINSDYTQGKIAIKIHRMPNYPEREAIKGYFKNIRIITSGPERYAREMDKAPIRAH